VPLYYSGIGAYVRKGDNKIRSVADINSPDLRIATVEGEMTNIIARQQFPKAQKVTLPQLSEVSQVLIQLEQNKADVTFVEPFQANEFMASRGEVFENIAQDTPLRVFGNTLMFAKGEFKLQSMLNTALQEDLQSGFVKESIAKYKGAAASLYPVKPPFDPPYSKPQVQAKQ